MKEISKLIDYRDSIKIVDATLRDGGLVNDFMFDMDFVKALYLSNVKSGVDYMEFGYKADRDLFDEKKFGPSKFSDDEYIRSVVGDNNTDLKIAVMADVGRCNLSRDLRPKAESPVDLVRVACYLHQIPAAVEMVNDAHMKGYETSLNIMAVSTIQEGDLRAGLDLVGRSAADIIYIVDSYGSLYPEGMARLIDLYSEYSDKYNKKLGIHAHNNQSLAFANTIEACGDGVDYLDATYNSLGRGAGNCQMELLISFLKNPKYNSYPVFEFIEKHMIPLKEQGLRWGYDIQYLMTGLLNEHPRSAIAFTKNNRTDYSEFYKELLLQD